MFIFFLNFDLAKEGTSVLSPPGCDLEHHHNIWNFSQAISMVRLMMSLKVVNF